MTSMLVVEDDPTVREMLELNLKAEGYAVTALADGESGLATARAQPFDLIVLDVMLPKLDGISLCRLIRKDSTVPIMLLTARGTEVDKIIGLESGADDYIVKPFGLGEFLARVRAALRRSISSLPPTPRDRLESNDLVLDLIARRVYLNEMELKMTHKELDLLAELMRNKGVVISRDLLLQKVWGYDYVGDSRTVDVHVRWLREKIEVNPSSPQRINTVRGVGYRFEG
ncbi:MAG: response regulator transcription factor [Chloroflexi bacterium]|nr:response regulator transcription factor [Chloroflexota bacterium]MBI5348280.1 response regulator transcription factor [Chloroflexota bacterium]MBI5713463.1 response regulator transcription factor [Chloroflexota bacterium]